MRAVNSLLFLAAALVAIPVLAVFSAWLQIDTDLWQHFFTTQLPQLFTNTFLLLLSVGFGVVVVGVSLAWLVSRYDFPGRHWLEWALMLPMALPAYVMAFVVLGLFEYSGPVQTWMRTVGLGAFTIADVRHLGSITLVMTSVFYPYVYLLARNAFLSQGLHFEEAAQSLGAGKKRIALSVNLAMARPAIIAGAALAMMETLADFGTVAVFNYNTFTTAIYKAWFDYFNLQLACQFASILLTLVFAALIIESRARGKKAYNDKQGLHQRKLLKGAKAWLASFLTAAVVFFCFMMPLLQLIHWAWLDAQKITDPHFLRLIKHTISLAAMAALVTALLAMLLALLQRHDAREWKKQLVSFSRLGYALPGTVLAVGIVMPLGYAERVLAPITAYIGLEPRQWLLGTVTVLIVAYVIRFLAVAMGPIESSLLRLKKSIPEAAISLGASPLRRFTSIYFPLLRSGILLAMLMVFVDVVKEMPATLLMRPFGWDTLAVRVFEMTSEGEYQRAALPALCILLVSIIPIVITIRKSHK